MASLAALDANVDDVPVLMTAKAPAAPAAKRFSAQQVEALEVAFAKNATPSATEIAALAGACVLAARQLGPAARRRGWRCVRVPLRLVGS